MREGVLSDVVRASDVKEGEKDKGGGREIQEGVLSLTCPDPRPRGGRGGSSKAILSKVREGERSAGGRGERVSKQIFVHSPLSPAQKYHQMADDTLIAAGGFSQPPLLSPGEPPDDTLIAAGCLAQPPLLSPGYVKLTTSFVPGHYMCGCLPGSMGPTWR